MHARRRRGAQTTHGWILYLSIRAAIQAPKGEKGKLPPKIATAPVAIPTCNRRGTALGAYLAWR